MKTLINILLAITLVSVSYTAYADEHDYERTVWTWTAVTEDTNDEPIEIGKYIHNRKSIACDGTITEEIIDIEPDILSRVEMTPPGTHEGIIIAVSDRGVEADPSNTAIKVIDCEDTVPPPPHVEDPKPKATVVHVS